MSGPHGIMATIIFALPPAALAIGGYSDELASRAMERAQAWTRHR
jgi:hypothetical protein